MCIPQDRLQVHGLAFHYLYGFYKLMAHDGFLLKKINCRKLILPPSCQ